MMKLRVHIARNYSPQTNAEENGSPASDVTSGVTKSALEWIIKGNSFACSA
jgi:hypothetical protein